MGTSEHIPVSSKDSEGATQYIPSSGSRKRQGHRSRFSMPRFMISSYFWLRESSFARGFLSGTWFHSIVGYGAALVFQFIVVIGLLALIHVYPSFRFPEGPLILVILLVSLGWGAGPGIVAMLVGACFLLYFVLPPTFSLHITLPEDVTSLCMYVVVGIIISILASNSERARRTSEQLRLQLNISEEQEHILSEVSKVLASTLDYQETLANITGVIVPQLADWFSVDLVDEQGNFELVEVGHKDPEQVQWARKLREKFPIDPASPTGAPHVVRTGESELYREITDEMLVASARSEEELMIGRQLGITSLMNVPLFARGKTIGVVAFVATESGRKYDERDLAMAEEVGRRAGVALDNARLFRDVQQASNQLDIILQGVADGIIVYNANSQIIYANEAAARMTRYSSVQAMLEMPSPDILSKFVLIDEQRQPFLPSRLTHRRVLAGEREAEAIIGYCDVATYQPENWSLVKSRPVLDAEGKVTLVITITHDITERMQAERRKDEFISMTSHELKTPVTSLKGYTYVLQRRLTKQGDEQGQQYLARIDAQLNKLTKLINDLLDISKMEAGKLALDIELFEVDALVRETVENVQAATSSHQICIKGSIAGCVRGDKDRLGQVLVNLLTNAIKYSPQADHVIVHLSQEQEQAIIRVQDFGIGIAEAYYQKIFDRFYQITDPEEKTFPGLGIGLYISADIVERHHGRIWVESKKGQGSLFSIALPLYKKLHSRLERGEGNYECGDNADAKRTEKNTRC